MNDMILNMSLPLAGGILKMEIPQWALINHGHVSEDDSPVTTTAIMKYVALLSGGKDSCYNLLHCLKNGHELIAAASLGPENGKGPTTFIGIVLT